MRFSAIVSIGKVNILPVKSRPSSSSSLASRIPIVKCNGKRIPAVHAAANPWKKNEFLYFCRVKDILLPIAVRIPAIWYQSWIGRP